MECQTITGQCVRSQTGAPKTLVCGLLSPGINRSIAFTSGCAQGDDEDVAAKASHLHAAGGIMGVRGIARAALIGSAALALGSVPAAAQDVVFSTTGAFSGGCTGTTCAFGSFTLQFQPVGSFGFLNGSLVDLGTFTASCSLSTCGPTNFPAGVTFTLTINQTVPSAGTGTFVGTIAGSLAYNPTLSALVWTPTSSTLVLGTAGQTATYSLVIDNTGNFNVEGPGAQNPNDAVVKAFVTTTTPEPSTVALMATGMFGLIPVIRRRRK
jgi:hypothetical protein